LEKSGISRGHLPNPASIVFEEMIQVFHRGRSYQMVKENSPFGTFGNVLKAGPKPKMRRNDLELRQLAVGVGAPYSADCACF
jgi:hypothetical protein